MPKRLNYSHFKNYQVRNFVGIKCNHFSAFWTYLFLLIKLSEKKNRQGRGIKLSRHHCTEICGLIHVFWLQQGQSTGFSVGF